MAGTPPGKFLQPEKKFRDAHLERFSIYVGQRVFTVKTQAFGDVVLVPSEDADGPADGDKVQAELHLTAEPDVIPKNAVFGRVGATFPNLKAKKKSREMETGKKAMILFTAGFGAVRCSDIAL